MKEFQKDMEKEKEEWRKKMEKMPKKNIQWEWIGNNEHKYDGKYEGQVKSSKPHGLGRWTSDSGSPTVLGKWKDGQLNGKVVEIRNHEDR